MSPLSGPALGRDQLLRVLALPNDARDAAIRSASRWLGDWLEGRKARLGPEAVEESSALAVELADLAQSTAWWTGGALPPASMRARFARGRPPRAVWLSGAIACLAILVAHAAGYRISRVTPVDASDLDSSRASTVRDGELGGATLRQLDVDRTGGRADEAVELRADLRPLGEAEAMAGRPLAETKGAPSSPPTAAAPPQDFATEEPRTAGGALGAEPEPAEPSLSRRGDFLAREGLPAMPDGGSTAWHDRVSGQLRDRYDHDGSGEIDRLKESEAISCSVWREIERDFKRGGLGLTMAHYFGFDGSEWHPGALAVARAHRSAVYAKMRECGLEP